MLCDFPQGGALRCTRSGREDLLGPAIAAKINALVSVALPLTFGHSDATVHVTCTRRPAVLPLIMRMKSLCEGHDQFCL